MSCDFMVFEPEAAPRDRKAFMAWFRQVTDWDLEADYENPATGSPRLQAWYADMIRDHRPLNGPDAVPESEMDDPTLGEYTITPAVIYAGFRWSAAEAAMEASKRLAFAHGLGFFDPQSDGDEIYFPDLPDGGRLKASGSWLSRLLG